MKSRTMTHIINSNLVSKTHLTAFFKDNLGKPAP